VDTAEFDYALPQERIAQEPLPQRDAARLLVDVGAGDPPEHRSVRDLPDLLEPGDLLVVNTSRVLPARLALRRPTGGTAEVLLLERVGADATSACAGAGDVRARDDRSERWEALVRPSRKMPAGTTLRLEDGSHELVVVVGDDLGEGRRVVEVVTRGPLLDALDRHGRMPLPPYITAPLGEQERYQTVYADRPGSAAAPTAGLHLTPTVLERCAARGVQRADVELVVGLGTFRPISAATVEDHVMHEETYRVPDATVAACDAAHAAGRAVVAVGTTSVRALESAAATGQRQGRTDLFIHRPYDWRVVDRLLTNFHLPRSSLLVMIDAFVGPRWRDLYATALATDYRFLSFGDAMLLQREVR
jgi:S-adenosylmethionine:tRNA ribosyltransferase-isomerase